MDSATRDTLTVPAARPTPTTVEVLLAPWRYLFRPGKAAERLIAARPGAIWLHFILGNLFLATTMAGLFFWVDANETTLRLAPPPSLSGGDVAHVYDWHSPSFAEVWAQWKESGRLAEIAEPITTLLGVFATLALLLAWVELPLLFRQGSIARAYLRSLRIVWSGSGWLTVLTLLVGVQSAYRLGEFVPHSVLGASTFLLLWMASAVHDVAVAEPEPPRSLLCEKCGYDLTHLSETGRCTECGMPLKESVEPSQLRYARGWEQGDGLVRWSTDSLRVFLTGARYYRRIIVFRALDARTRFVTAHLIAIGLGAAIWFGICRYFVLPSFGFRTGFWRQVESALLPAVAASLAGWITHRFVAAAVSTWWFARDMLPRPQVAYLVLVYETAFLWVFCLYNSVLLTSFFLYEDWMSELFGRQFWNNLFNAPTEPLALLGGNAALILWWMRRYHRCLMAVRWANH